MTKEILCPKCGKNFFPAPQHVFKDEKGFYCSWTCYNHRKDGQIRKTRRIEQFDSNNHVIRTFHSATQAAEYMGGTADGIRGACRTSTIYKGYLWRYKNDLP